VNLRDDENSPPLEGWQKFKEFLTGWFQNIRFSSPDCRENPFLKKKIITESRKKLLKK
jgi:hypothetical protein